MRKDGKVTFFQFEFEYKPGTWFLCEGQSELKGVHTRRPGPGCHWDLNPLWYEYTACGKCWQKYGYHGFLTEDEAMAALPLVRKCFSQKRVRIIRVTKMQRTEVVLMAEAPQTFKELKQIHREAK